MFLHYVLDLVIYFCFGFYLLRSVECLVYCLVQEDFVERLSDVFSSSVLAVPKFLVKGIMMNYFFA